MQSVPLKRKFTPIPAAYQKRDFPLDEVWSSLNRDQNKSWDYLLGEYRVVILAEAGAGKTYELQSAAKRLVSQGRRVLQGSGRPPRIIAALANEELTAISAPAPNGCLRLI